MDWKEVVETWNSACAAAGKGVFGNIQKPGDQKAVRGILSSGADASQVAARAKILLREDWRDHFTLSALWSGWEALGEIAGREAKKRELAAQSVGNPPSKIEEIKKVWAEPSIKAGDKAHAELVAWLKASGERIVAANAKKSSGDAFTDRALDVFEGEIVPDR
jgi:hypothetical protein